MVSKAMTRDEFEEWLEDRKDEAISDMPLRGVNKPLGSWLANYYVVLKNLATEESDDEGEEPDDDEESDDEEVADE